MTTSLYLGIDLGTSGVKAVMIDADGAVRASASAPLTVSQPKPRWSEQAPEDWWAATLKAVDAVMVDTRAAGLDTATLAGIGLSGQMHGATLLDAQHNVLRPAILWNDGRSDVECAELEQVAHFRAITGNVAMPGFTAPKLMWVRKHEPDIFARIDKVLLPKDYLRLLLTGELATDASDAAGTLWLDVAKRAWSEPMLAATGLVIENMPKVFEGSQATGTLLPALAERWGTACVPVAAGGGDNAAGAVGVGVVRPGQAMLSLGTSGVFFAVADGFHARPELAVHSFCHALPATWHVMSVMLNAASCLDFTARVTGHADVASLLAEAEAAPVRDNGVIFLPYLTGERTPHNDVHARGSFTGLRADTTRAELAQATLEGVGLGLLDGVDAVLASGVTIDEITVIGGGSRSHYWTRMLASIIGVPLVLREGGEVGPALGAARLARLAVDASASLDDVCPMPDITARFPPDLERHAYYRNVRQPMFRQLYAQLRGVYNA